MRCREAIRRLNKGGEYDKELIAHLQQCPACAGAAQTAQMLDTILTSSRDSQGYLKTPFSNIRAMILSRSAAENNKEKSFMFKIKNELINHPKISLGMTATILAIALSLLVPISYNKTVGYSLMINNVKAEDQLQPEALKQVIETLGYDKADFSIISTPSDSNYLISNTADKKAMLEVALALELFGGPELAYSLSPIVEQVTGNLISQITDKLSKIEINIKDKTDEEIAVQIKEKLKAEGYDSLKVFVQSDPDIITIRINGPRGDKELNRKIKIPVNENLESFDLYELFLSDESEFEIDFEGKTEDEIVKEVKDLMTKKGFPNADVKVKINDNGDQEIVIDIKGNE